MNTKAVVAAIVGTQLILGLILILILITVQGQNPPRYDGPYCSPQGVCDPAPGVGPYGLPAPIQ